MDRGTEALVTIVIFTALAGVFIVLRCISRFLIVRLPGKEDYLILVAYVLSIGLTINVALQRDHGLGKHARDLSIEDIETTLKLLYASIIDYNFGLLVVKASLLFQYLRIFVDRRYRLAAWLLMAFIWIGGITLIFVFSFSCHPVAYFWNASLDGKCIRTLPLWYTMSGFQLGTDFACLGLPIPVIVKLQLPRKQKISLIFVFILGGFGCIVSILRLHGLYASTISKDLTYDNATAVTWSSVEFNVGIMCASIPAMRPVISSIFPRLLGTVRHRTVTSNPFPPHSHSRAWSGRHDSTVELSDTRNAERPTDGGSSDQVSFDTATKEAGIHVKQEWSVGRAM